MDSPDPKLVPEMLDILRRFMRAADDHGHVNEPALRAAYKRASELFAKLHGDA